MKRLPVSLVLVSDYEPGEKTWQDERASLAAFLDDPIGVPDEVVIMESQRAVLGRSAVPQDIAALAPWVTLHVAETESSAALKDAALVHCRHDLIAVVEADCLPLSGWLAALVRKMDEGAGYAAVSGRTIYRGDTALKRVLSLLDRGFIDVPVDGEYVHVSNNGALYRRSLLERHRYPTWDMNPFVSAELRNRAMLQAGARFGVEANAVMHHAFGGLGFVIDVRRNKGYQAAVIAAKERPLGRVGSTIRAIRRTVRDDWRTVRHTSRHYVKRRDWPLLLLTFVAVRIPELAGAWHATRPEHDFAVTTPYR